MSKRKRASDQLWPGMTERQHKRLGKYVRELANVLGLYDWTLILANVPADEDALAQVDVTDGQHRAVLSVCGEWNTMDVGEKRRALVHELIHCHEQKAMESVMGEEAPMATLLGAAAWSVLEFTLHKDTEIMVDNLAIVIARMVDDSAFVKYLEDK